MKSWVLRRIVPAVIAGPRLAIGGAGMTITTADAAVNEQMGTVKVYTDMDYSNEWDWQIA